MGHDPDRTRGGTSVFAIGAGVLAVMCCAGPPLLGALAGSVALDAVLGLAAATLTTVLLIALVVLGLRARARRCHAPRPSNR